MTTSTLPGTVRTTAGPAHRPDTVTGEADVRAAVPTPVEAQVEAPVEAGVEAGVEARTGRADRVARLALVAPLLLFAHGITDWVDGLGGPDLPGGAGAPSSLGVATGALLVLATAGFAWLTTALGARAEHLPVAVPTSLLAAFGAGATGAVWVGGLTGLLPATVPTALAVGGQVLTGLALALVLATTWLEGRLPAGSLALAGGAAGLLALPWGLEPLGALVLLIALAPLTRST